MKRNVYVKLKGGVGNQLFQYAAAFSLARQLGFDLRLDIFSGFYRDHVYRRAFMLNKFGIHIDQNIIVNSYGFLFAKLFFKLAGSKDKNRKDFFWGTYLSDEATEFTGFQNSIGNDKNIWLDGYWQSEKYFKMFEFDLYSIIFNNLEIVDDTNNQIVVDEGRAIAICLRMYEEASAGLYPKLDFSLITRTANCLASQIEDPTFYIFATRRHLVQDKLKLNGKIIYLTADDGLQDEKKLIWLLGKFKFILITNSSLYWWGAWYAEKRNNAKVICCGVFNSSETVPDRWKYLVE